MKPGQIVIIVAATRRNNHEALVGRLERTNNCFYAVRDSYYMKGRRSLSSLAAEGPCSDTELEPCRATVWWHSKQILRIYEANQQQWAPALAEHPDATPAVEAADAA